MRTFAVVVGSLLFAGCPETAGQQCPANAFPVGQYALRFDLQNPGDACTLTLSDGGKQLIGIDGGVTQASTLCSGSLDDGGARIYLWLSGRQPRASDLTPDGGFEFRSQTDATPGTACVCPVTIGEVFAGNLVAAGDAGFALQPDGGLPPISGIAGSVSDRVDAPNDAGCACSPLPCQVVYRVAGTKF